MFNTWSVSAPSNAEAHDISLAIRQQRRDMGEIGTDHIMVKATDGAGEREYELALAAGDRVRLFRRTNAKFMETGTVGNIGRNGTVLEIAAIDEAGLTLKTITGREGLVAWESLRGEPNGRVPSGGSARERPGAAISAAGTDVEPPDCAGI